MKPVDAPAGAARLIELWRQSDGLWRWLYMEGADDVVLESNESYPRREDAERAATVAYPGVPVIERPEPEGPFSSRTRTGVRVVAVLAGALTFAVVIGGIAVWLALALAWRRLRRVLTSRLRR